MNDAREAETVRVSIDLAVDPATAFAAFTEDVDQWWARGRKNRFRAPWIGIMRFEPGPNGRLVEVYDDETGDLYEVGRITAWEPGRRLAFTWRIPNFAPDEITHVSITFEPIADGTRITLEHAGWETLRPDHPARHGLTGTAFRMMRSGWWADHLVAIRRHMEGGRP
jgi:uncharacterized protein YndB with AHSA1/START domain